MDLDEAVAELYAAPLEDFVAVRTRLAKGAERGLAQEIRALRKPTVTAWLLNQLGRESPEVVDAVGMLGGRMRAAQAAADMSALREARPERDRLIRDVVLAVREVADQHGRSLSTAGEDEVTATVIAALADEQSQAALGSGMLVRALSYSGFGEVDVDDAVAARARLRVVQIGQADALASVVRDAAGTAPDAEDEAEALALAEAEHAREMHEAQVRLQTAEADLARATADLAAAEEALADARERAAGARQEARRRHRERDAAATKVADLRRGRPVR